MKQDATSLSAITSTASPCVLALVYYGCPMLCNQVEQGVVGSLKMLSFNPGTDYEVVFVSFDSRESADMAAQKKTSALGHFGRPQTAAGWHFLTGTQDSIDAITQAANFRYSFDAKTNIFAHASGIMLLTPDGRISRYFYGVEYPSRDMRLGLVDASAGKIGTSDRSSFAVLLPVRPVDRALQRHDSSHHPHRRAVHDFHDRRGDFDLPAARSRARSESARSTLEPCSRNYHCIRSRRPTSLPA